MRIESWLLSWLWTVQNNPDLSQMTPLNISEAKSPALKRPWLDKNKLSPIFQAYAVDLLEPDSSS